MIRRAFNPFVDPVEDIKPLSGFWLEFNWVVRCGVLLFVTLLTLIFSIPVSADLANHHWQRFQQSDGIELYTNINTQVAGELLDALASFDASVDRFIQPLAKASSAATPSWSVECHPSETTSALKLVVVARRRDFVRLFKTVHFTALTLPTLHSTTLVVGPSGAHASLHKALFHEYVHYRLRRDVSGVLPLWFEEGLATYLSRSAVATTSDLSATPMPPARVEQRLVADLLGRQSLVGLSRSAVRQFYGGSHSLVQHLYSVGVDERVLAAALLRDGNNAAFLESLALDRQEVEQLIGGADDAFTVRNNAAPEVSIRMREQVSTSPPRAVEALAPNAVRRILAEAALLINPPAAAKLFTKAARLAPKAVWPQLGKATALRLQGKKQKAEPLLAAAETLATDDSADARVLLERAASLTTGCIVKAAAGCAAAWQIALQKLHRALALDPSNYDVRYRLGIAYLHVGQADDALHHLQSVWRRAPWSPRINYFLGECLRLGNDHRARWYLENAQRWAVSAYYQQAAAASLLRLTDRVDKLLE